MEDLKERKGLRNIFEAQYACDTFVQMFTKGHHEFVAVEDYEDPFYNKLKDIRNVLYNCMQEAMWDRNRLGNNDFGKGIQEALIWMLEKLIAITTIMEKRSITLVALL